MGTISPPPGVFPLFLRGQIAEKYGFKTGPGVMDLVAHLYVKKEDLLKDISLAGKMSDFQPAQKQIETYGGESLLFVVDPSSRYGEVFLLCYTDAAQEEFMVKIREEEAALDAQKQAELEAEEARKAAEWARLNIVYEDKPVQARPWNSSTSVDTEMEIGSLNIEYTPVRDPIAMEISRPKRMLKQAFKLTDRLADSGAACDFRAVKDPNFKSIRENEIGIQSAPSTSDNSAQTAWFRSVNKAIQYSAITERNNIGIIANSNLESSLSSSSSSSTADLTDLLQFLDKVTVKVESALQQNESVDIFHEAFRLVGDDDAQEGGAQADNELREIKNFADPNYSKMKALACIDSMPKAHGIVAVSAVRNMSFDQRITISGQTSSSYVLVWDFRQLVKPTLLMHSHHEVFTFRFNKTIPTLVAGGCITGQVVLWDLAEHLANAGGKKATGKKGDGEGGGGEEGDLASHAIIPKFISNVDYSHKKCVADLFWLPPTTQINYRGQLVGQEHLDGNSYQFITVAGDGVVMVWDIRYEKIAADELRHVGRAKHVPTEKSSAKEGSTIKLLWAPIFRAPLKRLEGVGELSLCKVTSSGNLKHSVASGTALPGDYRSHLMITTEEGDVLFADICASKTDENAPAQVHHEEHEEEVDTAIQYVKWLAKDHPRPSVGLQQSPFFPDVLLSVGDWSFHIWKVGEEKPLFSSPLSANYLTAGAWSPTRPAVLLLACADGHIMAWDFTDSSFRPSIELKATHAKITSMEFLQSSANARQQLLSIGDETGTLHVFEMPRNLIRPVHKEETVMSLFLEREKQRLYYIKENFAQENATSSQKEDEGAAGGGGFADPFNDGPTAKEIDAAAQEAVAKARHDAQKKEEDDFNKLEMLFITELGLTPSSLPSFIQEAYIQTIEKEKETKK